MTDRVSPTDAGWNEDVEVASRFEITDDFPTPALEDWRRVVDEDLKGADFEKKLVARTFDGIAVKPLYTSEDLEGLEVGDGLPGFAPYHRGSYPLSGVRPPWQIRQDCLLASPEEVNSALRDGLARGMNSICIRLDNAARHALDGDSPEARELAGRGGCTISSINGLRIALADIDLEKVAVTFRTGLAAVPILSMLIALADERGIPRDMLVGGVECDPLRDLAKMGETRASLDALYREAADIVSFCSRHCPGVRGIMVSSHPYHNSGASAAEEIACTLATGTEYLRALMARGIDVDTATRNMTFNFSVSTDIFTEIAKLRAARALWAKIVKALGAASDEAGRMFLHARTSAVAMTTYDPYNNMIRTAVEAFAGVVGGCDSMYVAPFCEPIGRAEEFGLRIARNQQLLLREESQLGRVVDPAAGSYFVESLTDSVARTAWGIFQEIEGAGGMARCLQSGVIQDRIAGTAAKREKLIRQRRQQIIGITNYPNPNEPNVVRHHIPRDEFLAERRRRLARLKSVRKNSRVRDLLNTLSNAVYTGDGNVVEIAIRAAREGATIGEINRALVEPDEGVPARARRLRTIRPAGPFEDLRRRAGGRAEKGLGEPRVLLVTFGPPAMRRARAEFCADFLGAGGLRTEEPEPSASADAAAAAIAASGAPMVVLCSDDATYPEMAPAIVQKAKASLPGVLVYVAGYPEKSVEDLKQAGVDGFIHIRQDAAETLEDIHKKLGLVS